MYGKMLTVAVDFRMHFDRSELPSPTASFARRERVARNRQVRANTQEAYDRCHSNRSSQCGTRVTKNFSGPRMGQHRNVECAGFDEPFIIYPGRFANVSTKLELRVLVRIIRFCRIAFNRLLAAEQRLFRWNTPAIAIFAVKFAESNPANIEHLSAPRLNLVDIVAGVG